MQLVQDGQIIIMFFQEYITLDGKVLRVFHADGRKKEVISPNTQFNRLIHAYTQKLFVGWTYGGDELAVCISALPILNLST